MPICTGCVIGGVCYGDGQLEPDNGCLFCDPTLDGTAWSDNDGAPCADDLFCTVDEECLDGSCEGDDRDCSDGVACNGTESCDEEQNCCIAGVNQCPDGSFCNTATDGCVTTCADCTIDGTTC